MRDERKVDVLLSAIATSASIFIVVLSLSTIEIVWKQTPNPANFFGFVFPDVQKFETKSAFFFFFVGFQVITIIGSIIFFCRGAKASAKRRKALLIQLGVVVFCYIGLLRLSYLAMAAAGKSFPSVSEIFTNILQLAH